MKRNALWLCAAALMVVIFGFMYLTVQQAQRSDANYPQIQIAEDAAAALNSGTKPAELVHGHVDIATSLAPFTIIFDKSGHVVASSGYLHGQVPQPPFGVLTAATHKSYSFVSWQPEPSVRIAAVTTTADQYYVLSGRSLTEVERNSNHTFLFAFVGGLVSLLILAGAYVLQGRTR